MAPLPDKALTAEPILDHVRLTESERERECVDMFLGEWNNTSARLQEDVSAL